MFNPITTSLIIKCSYTDASIFLQTPSNWLPFATHFINPANTPEAGPSNVCNTKKNFKCRLYGGAGSRGGLFKLTDSRGNSLPLTFRIKQHYSHISIFLAYSPAAACNTLQVTGVLTNCLKKIKALLETKEKKLPDAPLPAYSIKACNVIHHLN